MVCKSMMILRRALKVRQSMFQYYICKLIKCQGKLLEKNWRKANNMRLFYAIYRMLRHRLADDWAHGNLDNNLNFGMHERVISTRVRLFHQRRYMTESRVLQLKENRGAVGMSPNQRFENLNQENNPDGYSENHENPVNQGSESMKTWVDDDQTVKNPSAIVPITFDFESPMGPRQETCLIKLLQSSRNLGDCENGTNKGSNKYFKNNKFEEHSFVDTVGKSSFLKFKENWSDWVETEVVNSNTDWDKLINAT